MPPSVCLSLSVPELPTGRLLPIASACEGGPGAASVRIPEMEAMPLDPQANAIIEQRATLGLPPIWEMRPDEARQSMAAAGVWQGEPAPIAGVEDRTAPSPDGDIPVRIYTPEGSGPFPALVALHGGGWVIGSVEAHDGSCRTLANEVESVVVSVDYRLAPEHPYPAATEDAYAATQWVAKNGAALNVDPERIAVSGESAGGNLAAVVALMARDRGGPRLAFQLLVCPVTDHTLEQASYREVDRRYILNSESMAWFWDQYVPRREDRDQPYASPLRAPDLSGLPPALVITAEFDPLKDEGEAYAKRLQESGVAVITTRYEGMLHGFFQMPNLFEQARRAHSDAATALRQAFGITVSA